MKISAVIANYNHAHFLPDAIKGITSQFHQDWELVLVDDCSTDNSRAIISAAAEAEPRIRPFLRMENGGVIAAIAEGMAAAKGEVIFLGAADDYISDPAYFELVAREFEHNPGVAAVFGKCSVIDETTGAERWVMGSAPHPGSFTPEQCLTLFLEGRLFVPGASIVVRRGLFEQLGGFDPELGPQSDYFLNHAVGAHGGLVFVDRVATHVRLSENAYSRSDDDRAFFSRHAAVEKKLLASYAPLQVDPALVAKWRHNIINGRLGISGQSQFLDAIAVAWTIIPESERQNLPERFRALETHIAAETAVLRVELAEKRAAGNAIFDELSGPL